MRTPSWPRWAPSAAMTWLSWCATTPGRPRPGGRPASPCRTWTRSRARAFTRDTLRGWKLAPLEETVTLLVSEMVTNALVHTDGYATLELRRDEHQVRILVTDAHTRVPRPQQMDLNATGGRGLMLV